MEHICGFGMAALSPGRPGGFSGSCSTDKRQIRDQERADRELFAKNRGAFNAKQRHDYQHEQRVRNAARAAREGKLSRSEKRERADAKEAAEKKAADTMEAVREFNEARAKEKEPSRPQDGSQ